MTIEHEGAIMAWIARDKTGKNPYRLFGSQPTRLKMMDYSGKIKETQLTWSCPKDRRSKTYGPLWNEEPTEIAEADCPIQLEPGEGPIEVILVLKDLPQPRPFDGAGI
jgi:hypothetical protein